MDSIANLTTIDYSSLFVATFTVLIGIKAIVSIFEWIFDKLGLETKWMRKKREERELLIKTSHELSELKEKHNKDNTHVEKELSEFINEIKTVISVTQSELKQFALNRVHDREQSIQIQKEFSESIKGIILSNTEKDAQINNLMIAQREVLADKINDKYKYYISIKGIPEDEVEEFTNLHDAYKGVGGNHNGDAKYEYCINHLSVIPVETKLIIDH